MSESIGEGHLLVLSPVWVKNGTGGHRMAKWNLLFGFGRYLLRSDVVGRVVELSRLFSKFWRPTLA